MAKQTPNIKRIQKKFFASYWNKAVIAICVIGIYLCISYYGLGLYRGLIVAVSATLILFLIGWLVSYLLARMRTGRIRQRISQQGDIATFNWDKFHEVANSKYFYAGNDWLIWNKKTHYEIIHRDQIQEVKPLENTRAGNDLGQCKIFVKNEKEPILLTYDIDEKQDLIGALNRWANTNAARNVCPHCLAPIQPEDKVCSYCGSAL